MANSREEKRAEFNAAVENFQKKHGGELEVLLRNPQTEKAFWENRVVRDYITRPVSLISFVNNHPDLRDSKSEDEHNRTDHHELIVYKSLPGTVAYRAESITSPTYYVDGPAPILNNNGHDFFSKLFVRNYGGLNDIEVGLPQDIYKISASVHERFLLPKKSAYPRFLVFKNGKDDHASTCVSVLDPIHGHVLITLLINSRRDDNFYEFTKARFLRHSTSSLSRNENDVLNYLKTIFPSEIFSDISLKSMRVVNRSARTALIVDAETDGIANHSDVERVFYFNERWSLRFFPKSPFIDASHNLQENDRWCALYSVNLIDGIVAMLKQPEMAEQVFKLACSVKAEPSAEEKLILIFRNKLKAYLPCYYDASGNRKPREEIEEFHLKKMWDLGSDSILLSYPLAQIALPDEKKQDEKKSFSMRT